MPSTLLTDIEREIIADIHAVCRRCGWPTNVRPRCQDYFDQRGHFYEKQIKRLGGWKKVCARGGMHDTPLGKLRRNTLSKRAFGTLVADVRRVAESLRLKPGVPLICAAYLRSGGMYGVKAIARAGGWIKVSAAAGVPSRPGGLGKPLRQWHKTQSALTRHEIEAALAQASGHTPVPQGLRRIMGGKRGRKSRAETLYRQVPELERGEIIADIREVSLSLGLLSPHLLTFDTYRDHGGRYTFEQALTLGGFDTLRRAA